MSWNFRKRKKIGIFNFSLGKKGISTSVGGKGFRVTKSADGKTRVTTSIPGTGLYKTSVVRDDAVSDEAPKPHRVRDAILIELIIITCLIFGVRLISCASSLAEPDKPNVSETAAETVPKVVYIPPESPFDFYNVSTEFVKVGGAVDMRCALSGIRAEDVVLTNENPELIDVKIKNAADEGIVLSISGLAAGTAYYTVSDGGENVERINIIVEDMSSASSDDDTRTYICNVNTKVFHLLTCSVLPESENRATVVGRSRAISEGYTPCKVCNP